MNYRQIVITTVILSLFALTGTTMVAFTWENTREQIEADIQKFGYEDSHDWAEGNDALNSEFHITAYDNGWVRWRTDMAGGWDPLNISGSTPYIQQLLSSRPMLTRVKAEFEQYGELDIEFDLIDNGRLVSPNTPTMRNMIDYNRVRRQLQ